MNLHQKIRSKIGDSNARILRGMGLVTGFLILGKCIAAVKEMAIAYRYGTEQVVDVYVFSFVLVSWFPVVAHSVLQSVLVPLLNKLEPNERSQFVSQLSGFVLLGGAVVMLIIIFLLTQLVSLLAGGMSGEAQSDVRLALLIMSPCAVLLFIVALYSAELLSREKHANTLLEALQPLAILICVLFWPTSEMTMMSMVFGTIAGIALHASLLLYICFRSSNLNAVSFSFSSAAWPGFWQSCSVLLVGVFVLSFVRPFDQYLASSLGDGSVASLSYATRLLALGLALGTTVLSRALLPVLSGRNQTFAEKVSLAKQWSILVFFSGIVAFVIGWFLTPLVVQLLFERGEFNAQDTARVSVIVRAGLIQMPFLLGGMVLVQLFASLGEYKRIAASSFIGVGVKVLGGFALVPLFGVSGITMATGLMYAATFCFFFWSINFRLKETA